MSQKNRSVALGLTTYFRLPFFVAVFLLCVAFLGYSSPAQAASLSIGPTEGTFAVGNTFDASVFLNTQGEAINTLKVTIKYPADKLQVVSPSTGRSIISLWTSQPKFNNQTGVIELQGGIPGGITTSNGLVTTITFRVKAVGQGVVKFLDDTRVLLNDGLGTDSLRQTNSGVYELVLPPPAGPTVVSETHPDQTKWYPHATAILSWAPDENVQGYSYVLNKEPVDFPDDISEGLKTTTIYKNSSDGTNYFHIKALREKTWGGSTHFALNIDSTPPAEFPVEIIPGNRTSRRQPVIQFTTTDAASGIEHYELKLVPLQKTTQQDTGGQPLFIEVTSPYITQPLELGSYDVIVRAYDKAGNYQEKIQRLKITTAVFKFVDDRGIEVRSLFVIPWWMLWVLIALLIALFGYGAWRSRAWHHGIARQKTSGEHPSHVKDKLAELKRYQAKYGKIALFILMLTMSLCGGLIGFVNTPTAHAQQQIESAPPLITTISRDITNEEIFYAGGKTEAGFTEVILYLQNLQSGETISAKVVSDKRGDWFYRHENFLTSGNYLLWTQSKIGEQTSPPSPQIQMTVRPTAIQFGASRLSREVVYLIITIILLLVIVGLIGEMIYHTLRGRKKHAHIMREVKEAEASILRGFAVLRRDIEAELAVIKKAKLSKELSHEEREKEQQLLKDLDAVQRKIGKEVWDIEHAEEEKV